MARVEDPTLTAGRALQVFTGLINQTDTTSRALFTIPAGSIIVGGNLIVNSTASNATGLGLSVGIAGGLGNEYLNAWKPDNSTGSNGGVVIPQWQNFGAQSSNYAQFGGVSIGSNALTVTGKITGAASGNPGPWVVVFHVLDV
jgi:hypothetical protein